MDMHWWDLNTKPFRRFLLIIAALLEESERHYHKTISPIFFANNITYRHAFVGN